MVKHNRFFVWFVQEANVYPCILASATTAIHIDCLVLASNTPWPEIQPLVSWGQIIQL